MSFSNALLISEISNQISNMSNLNVKVSKNYDQI